MSEDVISGRADLGMHTAQGSSHSMEIDQSINQVMSWKVPKLAFIPALDQCPLERENSMSALLRHFLLGRYHFNTELKSELMPQRITGALW